jgi:hypothetical protein
VVAEPDRLALHQQHPQPLGGEVTELDPPLPLGLGRPQGRQLPRLERLPGLQRLEEQVLDPRQGRGALGLEVALQRLHRVPDHPYGV